MNEFKNDTERINELKSCIETIHDILHNSVDMRDVDRARTLARDTLSRYNEDKKFVTAEVISYKSIEMLKDWI